MAKLQSRSSLVNHLRLCHKPELLKFQEESPYVNAAAGSLFRSKMCNKVNTCIVNILLVCALLFTNYIFNFLCRHIGIYKE